MKNFLIFSVINRFILVFQERVFKLLMKRKEYKLLVESWRKVLSEENSQDDDSDLYAPVEDQEGDQLDRDMDYVESQVDSYRESDAEREAMLQRFCDMFGVARDDIESFLENQAFDAGYDMEGEEFDSNQVPDDMPLDDDEYDGDIFIDDDIDPDSYDG